MATKAFVYKWTHIPTNKWYIGSRTRNGCHPDDGYICSSKIVKPMIEASPQEWVREVLVIGNPRDMAELESKYLQSLDAKNDEMSFNRHNNDGVFSMVGKKHSVEAKRKMKKDGYSEEYRERCRQREIGKKHSDATKKKMSLARKGKKMPDRGDEWRQKISASKSGKPISEEHKRKVSEAITANWAKRKAAK